jgi:hypothetical protein
MNMKLRKTATMVVLMFVLGAGGCGITETVGAQTAPKSAVPERVDLSGAFDDLGVTLATVEPSQDDVGAAVAAKAARLEAERVAAEKAAAEAAEKAAAEAAAKKKSSGAAGSGGSSGNNGSSNGGKTGGSNPNLPDCAPYCPDTSKAGESGLDWPKCNNEHERQNSLAYGCKP